LELKFKLLARSEISNSHGRRLGTFPKKRRNPACVWLDLRVSDLPRLTSHLIKVSAQLNGLPGSMATCVTKYVP
jgi:hypothetical protein